MEERRRTRANSKNVIKPTETKASTISQSRKRAPTTKNFLNPSAKKTKCLEKTDQFSYSTNGPNRGKVLIINNINFFDKRYGAEKDDEDLSKLMKRFGLKVSVIRDLKKQEMEQEIKKLKRDEDLGTSDMLILVMMSHGDNKKYQKEIGGDYTKIIGTDEKGLTIEDVLKHFTAKECPLMAGKPKIFIFQCCRGDRTDTDTETPHKKPIVIGKNMENHGDMLVAFSTLPGFCSLRNSEDGTWYIQSLVKVFRKYAKDKDIETMLKLVDQELLAQYPDYLQTSSYESRGFNKSCYLNPVR